MTNKEAAKILGQYDVSDIHFYTTDGEEIPFDKWSDAIEMAIKALESQEWIPCSERLPGKHGEMYLVTISDGAIYSAALQWDINRKRWYLSFLNNGEMLIDYIDDVIAWMPLPECYQEDI